MIKSIVQTADRFTEAQSFITTDHAYVHDQIGYSVSGLFTGVSNGATVNYSFKTPASGYIHLKYNDYSGTGTSITTVLYEAPTNAPTGGTALTPINRSRTGTPPASRMQTCVTAATIDATGAVTLATQGFSTTVTKSLDIEFVLKPNTWYIRTFTNNTGGAATISFFEFWYEEVSG